MEAKNPWRGLVTGPLVREEVWQEATVSSVARKWLIPGSPACGTGFDIGAYSGASCFHRQPPSPSFGPDRPLEEKDMLCVG